MKHRIAGVLVILGLAVITWLPSQAFGFAFSATNFKGYAAYDKAGDVVGAFNLDPRLSYAATGKKFNASAGMGFDFQYTPNNAPFVDMLEDPLEEWCWTLSIKDLYVPGHGTLPELSFSRRASYSNLAAGAGWFQAKIDEWDIDGMLLFDYAFLTPNSGKAGLLFAGNINPCLVPGWVPDRFFCPIISNATVTLTAAPCDTQPVPEPTTLALFTVGVIGAGAMRKKLRK